MMLTDLAEAARKSGLKVVEDPGWKTRGHGGGRCYCTDCPQSGPQVAVQSIVLHHTAGPATGEAPSMTTVREGRPNLKGPLSHLVLGRSGTVYVVAAGLCWHAGATFAAWQSNPYSIGIEAEATGTDEWPTAQYAAYLMLAKALADHYRVPYNRVLGHKEVAEPAGRKVDPNLDCAAFRAALLTVEDFMADAWAQTVTNAFGDRVQAIQVVNGIEKRVSDLQDAFGKLVVGGGTVDVDVLAEKVADLLAARLKS